VTWKGRRVQLAAIRDIGDRARTEGEPHRRAEPFTNTILETVEGLILVLDPQGCIVHFNAACERLSGWSRHEAVGRCIWEYLVPEEDRVRGRNNFDELLRDTAPVRMESVWVTRDRQRRTIQWADSVLLDSAGAVELVMRTGMDVTEMRRLEERLREAQKMQSIGLLAGGVAHDFNNLLMVINGYASMIRQKTEPGNPICQFTREIEKAGDRATRLTSQLLAFGQKQFFRVKPVDANELLGNSKAVFEALLGDRIDLRICPGASPSIIMADADQIQHVLVNLVSNAREAMPEGGRVEMATWNVEFASSDAALHRDASAGSFVGITVRDSGIGMDAKTMERVFEPFYTTKDFGLGSGLGLSSAYGIARQSGGWIDVSSEPGRGSCFTVYLPRFQR
jgi:PAS domain S-box-containing protein